MLISVFCLLLFQTSDLESLLCKQEGAALAPAHMDLFDGGTSSRDDAFLRPALWEDIASSIRNIDPENANMLAPLGATHVKLEAEDALLEECATPLLSPLEIKTERLCAPTYAQPQPPPHAPQHQPTPSFSKFPPSRLVYMSPLTPPGSDQGSPGNSMQVIFRVHYRMYINQALRLLALKRPMVPSSALRFFHLISCYQTVLQ